MTRKTFTVADIEEVQLVASMASVEAIWAVILFKNCTNPVQFYASPHADNDFAKEMYQRFIDEEYGEPRHGFGEPFTTQPKEQGEVESDVIAKRNQLLADSDWTELPSRQASLSAAQKTAWAAYRQELRDVPDQPSFPWDPVWPSMPE